MNRRDFLRGAVIGASALHAMGAEADLSGAAAQSGVESVIPAIPAQGTWTVDLSGVRATTVTIIVESLEGFLLAQKTVNVANQVVTLYNSDLLVDSKGQPLPAQYSFASQAKSPGRMLNAEGLTANGAVQAELPAPYAGTLQV